MAYQIATPNLFGVIMEEAVTKAEFARQIGVSRARVSQLVGQGLPVLHSGKVPVRQAHDWVATNIKRRQKPESALPESDRARLDRIKADQAELELERTRGTLLDRAAAEGAIFERAKAERDAHLAWVSRIATPIAAQTGADPAALFAALDAAMRDHLAELAEKDLTL